MDANVRRVGIAVARAKTYYERWMEKEGVPIVEGFGVTDVQRIALRPWSRLGCDGAYLQLRGLEGITGVYVGKLAPGTMTEPEKHLYEKVIYIVQGEGVAEFQQRGRVPQSISWKTGSLFSPPLNSTHRLINYSKTPAVFVAVTTAPMVLDHFHNEQFVFHNDFVFNDRYDGEGDYFNVGDHRYLAANNRQWIWDTNFIPDARKAAIDAQEQKGAGVNLTQFEIADNTLIGHLAEWPVGRYHKAHYHGGGAVLVILRSEGYSLMWPNEWGTRPYENGYGDRVVKIDWGVGQRILSADQLVSPTFQYRRRTGAAVGAPLRQPQVPSGDQSCGDSSRRLYLRQARRHPHRVRRRGSGNSPRLSSGTCAKGHRTEDELCGGSERRLKGSSFPCSAA